MLKIGMVGTSSTDGLGPQTSQFNSVRSMSSRTRNAAGNTLTRDWSGKSSWTGTPVMATPPSITSTNSFGYAFFVFPCTNGSIFRNESESKDDDHLPTTPARVQEVVAPKTKSQMEDTILPHP